MNLFQDILVPEAVKRGFQAAAKKQLFQRLSDIAADCYGLSPALVVERLTERERLGSTGFGGGIAIPHAKLEGIGRMCAIVTVLDHPIEFEAVDGAPVDVIFTLLSPLESGADHLKNLARVSRFLRNDAQIARMRGAGSDAALWALLSTGEARDAA